MPWETAGEWTPISSMAQGIVSSTKEGPQSTCHGKPLADMRADGSAQLTSHISTFPSSSSQLPMVAEQDSRGFENSSLQISASAAPCSAQQNVDPQGTMGNSQQMIDEVIAEQMRIAAAAEQQQQLAYQNATSQPQDCHMSDQRAIGDLPKAYNIGTPPEGDAGTLQPRETVGGYGPVLHGATGRGRRSSPRTPGRSPRGDRVSGVGRRPREDSTWIQPTTRPSSQLWTPQKQSLAMELQQLRATPPGPIKADGGGHRTLKAS